MRPAWVSGHARAQGLGVPGGKDSGARGAGSPPRPLQAASLSPVPPSPPSKAHWYLSLGPEERAPGEGGSTSTAGSPARPRPGPACGRGGTGEESALEPRPAHPSGCRGQRFPGPTPEGSQPSMARQLPSLALGPFLRAWAQGLRLLGPKGEAAPAREVRGFRKGTGREGQDEDKGVTTS